MSLENVARHCIPIITNELQGEETFSVCRSYFALKAFFQDVS